MLSSLFPDDVYCIIRARGSDEWRRFVRTAATKNEFARRVFVHPLEKGDRQAARQPEKTVLPPSGVGEED